MHMRRRHGPYLLALLVGSFLASACGPEPAITRPDANATPGPGSRAELPLHVLDGLHGFAVNTYDGPVRAMPNTKAQFDAQGYLRRDTLVPHDGVIWLWPITVSETYTLDIVYRSDDPILHRWPEARSMITVGERATDEVIAEIASTRTVQMVRSSLPSVDIAITVDPAETCGEEVPNLLGCTYTYSAGGSITRARIVLTASDVGDAVLLHELGHALGLGHSPRPEDLMYPMTHRGQRRTFGEDERALLTMMYEWRRPGNATPDDDSRLIAAGGMHEHRTAN